MTKPTPSPATLTLPAAKAPPPPSGQARKPNDDKPVSPSVMRRKWCVLLADGREIEVRAQQARVINSGALVFNDSIADGPIIATRTIKALSTGLWLAIEAIGDEENPLLDPPPLTP